jgi:hypothetical protein
MDFYCEGTHELLMKTYKINDEYRCFLTVDEFNKFCQKAKNKYGEDEYWVLIGIKLLALSVRVGTLERIYTSDFKQGERGVQLLQIWEKNSRNEGGKRRPRDIWIPNPVYNSIQAYIDEKNKEDDRLIPKSESTFRRRFNNLTEELAEETGNNDWEKLTPHDLRRYFAVHFLFRHRIDPGLVRQMGGWSSQESMVEYLILPDDVLVDEIESMGIRGTDATIHVNSAAELESIVKSIQSLLAQLDSDERPEAAESLEKYLSKITGITANINIDSDAIKNMNDPAQANQRVLKEYSGVPLTELASTFADKVEEEYDHNITDPPINLHPQKEKRKIRNRIEAMVQNKIEQFEDSPQYIDIHSKEGIRNLSLIPVTTVAATVVFSMISPYTLVEIGLMAIIGIALAAAQINKDLNQSVPTASAQ